jgi:hypothetical protein
MHRWGAMNAELECIACNVKRVVIQVSWSLEGTRCGLSNAPNVVTS